MKRYTSKYGTVYEIAPDGTGYLLSKVHTEVRLVRRKEVKTERKQCYLRSNFEDCFRYMLQVDKFSEDFKRMSCE